MDFITVKNFCPLKDTIKEMNSQTTDREKLFAEHISDKIHAARIYKELLQISNRKINYPVVKS